MMVTAAAIACLALWLLQRFGPQKPGRPSRSDISLTAMMAGVGALIGAAALRPIMRIIETAAGWEQYRQIPAGELLGQIFNGEFVFYGGLLGGAAALLLFCRRYKLAILPTIDLFAPALALGHAVGRIGCHFAGCCYGVEVAHDHPFAIIYPPESIGAPPGIPLLAAPLIESAFLFLLAGLLAFVYIKSKKTGLCLALYALMYSAQRFVLEFYRGDLIRGTYGAISTSQYISMALFVFGIVFTKCDKQSPGKTEANIDIYRRTLSQWWEEMPPMFATSSEKRQGRDEILSFIGRCLGQ